MKQEWSSNGVNYGLLAETKLKFEFELFTLFVINYYFLLIISVKA